MLIGPPISHINHLRQKLVEAFVCYFLSNFYFSSNDSPSKTTTNAFFFHLKSSLRSQDIQILAFRSSRLFSLSAIALEVDPRKILKFMTSSTV